MKAALRTGGRSKGCNDGAHRLTRAAGAHPSTGPFRDSGGCAPVRPSKCEASDVRWLERRPTDRATFPSHRFQLSPQHSSGVWRGRCGRIFTLTVLRAKRRASGWNETVQVPQTFQSAPRPAGDVPTHQSVPTGACAVQSIQVRSPKGHSFPPRTRKNPFKCGLGSTGTGAFKG